MSPLAPLEFDFYQGLRDLARRAAPGAPLGLVIAVSGGRDSMALLAAASRVARHRAEVCSGASSDRTGGAGGPAGPRELPRTSVRVVHFHHGTRPGGNDADEAFVIDRALSLGVPVSVHRFDGAAAPGNFHSRAREFRYTRLERERVALRASLGGERTGARAWILTAHHARDAVESMLLHLARGAGPEGLRGIAAVRPEAHLWRPFARVPEAAISAYAASRALEWREDPSNASLDYDRNKVRLRVLPALAEINPSYEKAFLRFADALEATLARPGKAAGPKGDATLSARDIPWGPGAADVSVHDAEPNLGAPRVQATRSPELAVSLAPGERAIPPGSPHGRAPCDPSSLRSLSLASLASVAGPSHRALERSLRALTLAHWTNLAGHVDKARRAPPASRAARGLRVPLAGGLEVSVFANAMRFTLASSPRRIGGAGGPPDDDEE